MNLINRVKVFFLRRKAIKISEEIIEHGFQILYGRRTPDEIRVIEHRRKVLIEYLAKIELKIKDLGGI